MLSTKPTLKILILGLLVTYTLALEEPADDSSNSLFSSDDDLDETGRVAFVTVDNNGIVITWNATSILYGALAALALGAVAAAVAIPLALVFGLKKAFYDDDYDYSGYSGSGSGGGYGGSGSGHGGGGSSYTDYAKRSLEVMSPVMKALYGAYQKYNNQDENGVHL